MDLCFGLEIKYKTLSTCLYQYNEYNLRLCYCILVGLDVNLDKYLHAVDENRRIVVD